MKRVLPTGITNYDQYSYCSSFLERDYYFVHVHYSLVEEAEGGRGGQRETPSPPGHGACLSISVVMTP
jgi:hypothetical protein